MDWIDIMGIDNDEEKTIAVYDKIYEETRLNVSNSTSIEFFTTTKYIEQIINKGDSILELGAGTGAYSLYLARKGYAVTAVELSDRNISVLKSNISKDTPVDVIKGNALNLNFVNDKSFDAVLLFGPLYHLTSRKDKIQCLKESLRVLKDDGYIFISLINNDMVPMCEMKYQKDYFIGNCFDHESFIMENFPYAFHTLEDSRNLLDEINISIIKEIASDGLSLICSDEIDKLDEKNLEEYKKFHLYMCEKPSFLSASSHFLFIGKK